MRSLAAGKREAAVLDRQRGVLGNFVFVDDAAYAQVDLIPSARAPCGPGTLHLRQFAFRPLEDSKEPCDALSG